MLVSAVATLLESDGKKFPFIVRCLSPVAQQILKTSFARSLVVASKTKTKGWGEMHPCICPSNTLVK